MKNKKKLFIVILGIALFVFVGLYLIINYSEPNILSSEDKKWLSDNGGKIIDIDVINNIPVYANNGSGVIFDYLKYVQEKTNLEFNKIPYLSGNTNLTSKYKFEVVDGSSNIQSNQLLIYNDSYVCVEKNERKINSVNDLAGLTVGVLESDTNIIGYYLENVSNLKIKNYETITSVFNSLDSGEVNMVIVPHMMNLSYTIGGNYKINYFFNNISKNIVLTMDSSNKELNNILTKTYNSWFDESYVKDYNKILLDYYISMRGINDKAKADLLSKTYVYGYVENEPYEFSIAGHMEGIAIEYLKRIIRLTDIDVTYQKYENVNKLKEGINKGEVDIYFDYFGLQDSKYLKAKSVFIENYVVLGKGNTEIIENIESLKGKNISTIINNSLVDYLKANTKANVAEKTLDELTKDNLIVIDREVYNYYRNSKFKDYEVLYADIMSNDYTFMVKSNNDSFFNLFDYFINTNSYYNYRNSAYTSFNGSIFDKVTFEELYLIILAIILVPVIGAIIVYVLFKNKRKLKIMRKDDRKKYTDMMTSLKNRNYLNLNIEKWNQNKVYPQAIVVIDLNNTKYINDNYGREKGDLLITRASSILINTQLENSEIIRSDGNEFLIYMIGYNENQIDIYTKKLAKSLNELPYGFGAAIGYSMILDNIKTIDDAINEATIAMQSDKESYK